MARKGDPILSYMTADWYNQTVARNKASFLGGAAEVYPTQYLTVEVYNPTSTMYERYRPVALGTIRGSWSSRVADPDNFLFNIKPLTADEPDNWVVLQERLEGRVGAVATALLIGATWLYTVDDPTTHELLSVQDDPGVLKTGGSGKGYVLHKESITSPTGFMSRIAMAIPGGGGITNLRLNGSNLQYFKNGVWTTWHVATSCEPITSS